MDLLQGLQSLLGEGMSGGSGMGKSQALSGGGMDALSGLLSPAVLGGIASALFANKGGMGGSGMEGLGGILSSLLSGGTTVDLPQQHAEQVSRANAGVPRYDQAPASQRERAIRLLRALVYAAKSDGHIDENESAAIYGQLQKLNIGSEGEIAVKKAMEEPLDPNLIATGVLDPQEAMQIYALSCAVCNADQFMERSYLDSLATALRIPQATKAAIEEKVRQ